MPWEMTPGPLQTEKLDLIGVPRTLRKDLERRCADAYTLPAEGLLLNASHTHSGPEFRVGRMPADDGEFKPTSEGEAYGRHLDEQLFKLIGSDIWNNCYKFVAGISGQEVVFAQLTMDERGNFPKHSIADFVAKCIVSSSRS